MLTLGEKAEVKDRGKWGENPSRHEDRKEFSIPDSQVIRGFAKHDSINGIPIV